LNRGRRVFGGDPIGLCGHCLHARRVPTVLTAYWMCERSLTDGRYEKYPRLPVISCAGFEERPVAPPAAPER
jgi:hypothetical protein